MPSIIQSVLRFARDEETERWAIDVSSLLRRSVDLIRSEFDAERLTVRLALQDETGP